MSDNDENPSSARGKHAKPEKDEPPKWPGGDNDPGKAFDAWLAESNRKAEGK